MSISEREKKVKMDKAFLVLADSLTFICAYGHVISIGAALPAVTKLGPILLFLKESSHIFKALQS